MSRYIGKRVFYTCDNCGKSFSLNKKSRCEDDKNFCSQNCLDNLKPKIMSNKSIEVGSKVIFNGFDHDDPHWVDTFSDMIGREYEVVKSEYPEQPEIIAFLDKELDDAIWYVPISSLTLISKSTDGEGKKEEGKTAESEILEAMEEYKKQSGLHGKKEERKFAEEILKDYIDSLCNHNKSACPPYQYLDKEFKEEILSAMEEYANQFKQSALPGLKEKLKEIRVYTEEEVFEFLTYIREYEDFYNYMDDPDEPMKKLIKNWKPKSLGEDK